MSGSVSADVVPQPFAPEADRPAGTRGRPGPGSRPPRSGPRRLSFSTRASQVIRRDAPRAAVDDAAVRVDRAEIAADRDVLRPDLDPDRPGLRGRPGRYRMLDAGRSRRGPRWPGPDPGVIPGPTGVLRPTVPSEARASRFGSSRRFQLGLATRLDRESAEAVGHEEDDLCLGRFAEAGGSGSCIDIAGRFPEKRPNVPAGISPGWPSVRSLWRTRPRPSIARSGGIDLRNTASAGSSASRSAAGLVEPTPEDSAASAASPLAWASSAFLRSSGRGEASGTFRARARGRDRPRPRSETSRCCPRRGGWSGPGDGEVPARAQAHAP